MARVELIMTTANLSRKRRRRDHDPAGRDGRRLSRLPGRPARAWGITDDSYLVPIATMVGANLHGGLVLGAFLPGGEAVAMSFAFLGRIEGRLCLYSQLTGVVPGYQSRGLGYQIKLRPAHDRPRRGDRAHRLGVRPPPGRQRPFQPRPARGLGRALRRKHVRPTDRRPQRRRPDRPPDRRVGHRRAMPCW